MGYRLSSSTQVSGAHNIGIIRMKAMTAFRRHGVKVEQIDAVTLGAASGARFFSLVNLATRCNLVERSMWDEVIDDHARTMAASTVAFDPLDLSDDEFHSRLRERILSSEFLRQFNEYDYARPLIARAPGGLQRALCLSFPGRAITLADRHLVGRDLDAAWAVGRENTANVPLEIHEDMIKDGITIEVRRGNSIFVASKVADMPTLIDDFLGESPNGVLFAIPTGYEIDYYRPQTLENTVGAVLLLDEVADMVSHSEPSPLSARVYLWRDGQFTQVSATRPSGLYAQLLSELPD